MYERTSGAYFGGLNNVLTATRIDDLPEPESGFESVAKAADREMIAVLRDDLDPTLAKVRAA